MHSVDAVLLLDIFLNRQRFPFFCLAYFGPWTCVFVVFQWIVHACVSMWWYAKRFLHPDIVATYDYTFIWDEDLGFEHFNADKYIQMVKKHGLEISQPGLEPNNGLGK
ncbi:hypothetical protein HanHA300_Chr16g0591211 [Helianthus annuus]|nr:hypothetical protein HanHA300_Chr16g0591211 [Helianthus annuus]